MKIGEKQTNNLMTISKQIVTGITILIFPLLYAEKVFAESQDLDTKVSEFITDWKSFPPERLLAKENADLLVKLRLMAKETSYTSVKSALIKIGDEDVIQSSIDSFRNARPTRRGTPARILSWGANPEVISRLIDSLFVDESPEMLSNGDDQFYSPLSVLAASIIKNIVIESPAFTPKLNQWAKQLPVDDAEIRAIFRQWWAINKDALLRKDYAACVPVPGTQREIKRPDKPVVTPKPELPLSKREPKERPPAHTEEEGKTPIWPWLAGISALAVLGVILWIRRG